MTSHREAVRRALGAYSGSSRGDRLHVWIRWRTCPFDPLEARVPSVGRVLDIGCGHGLFALLLALSEPGRAVSGTDVDAAKLAVGRQAAARAGADVALVDADRALPPGPWEAITIVDVLYLLGHDDARALLGAAAHALAPGGTLLVKEIDDRPHWKHHLARMQELVSTRVLRITEGTGVHFLPPAEIASTMEAAGLSVERVRLDRRRLHPHHLVIGRRPPLGRLPS